MCCASMDGASKLSTMTVWRSLSLVDSSRALAILAWFAAISLRVDTLHLPVTDQAHRWRPKR